MERMAWDDFRLVKAVADSRSLTGAADALGVNHSTVFRRLGEIEKRLGTPLFERHRAGYGMTPAGEEMVALAERMERDVLEFPSTAIDETALEDLLRLMLGRDSAFLKLAPLAGLHGRASG